MDDANFLNAEITDLRLPGRVSAPLLRAGVLRLRDLLAHTPAELLTIPTFGHGALGVVVSVLSARGLSLRHEIVAYRSASPTGRAEAPP